MNSSEPSTVDLTEYGWNPSWAEAFAPFREKYVPGRVVLEQRGVSTVMTEYGEIDAKVAGRLRHQAAGRHELPAIGDWVAVQLAKTQSDQARIRAVLPRTTKVSRKAAGARTEEQVVAANVDTLFVVMALDNDFSLRRLERYLATAWESGAQPVVLLNKPDLAEDLEQQVRDVEALATATVPVHVVAAKSKQGLEVLETYLGPGQTIALVGSSGVGKSTLINGLAGREVMATAEVRESDDRGQHTTSHRELVRLDRGALLIDNPGIRELQLWTSDESLTETFEDVEGFAAGCRFRDCGHTDEPGCAVREAVREGTLDASRLRSYFDLQKELAALNQRQNQSAAQTEKKKWRTIHKDMRRFKKPGR